MCGIVGYIGNNNVTDFLLCGLSKLEYRGYDSAGIAVLKNEEINVLKKEGRIDNLKKEAEKNNFNGDFGIGHTRWATHGAANEINCHPHLNEKGDIAVVHNGIIENYKVLKSALISKGYKFVSETDTEVIPHLIDYYYENDLLDAVKKTARALEGSFSIGVLSAREPDKIVATLKGSRLIASKDENGAFIASDVSAAPKEMESVYVLADDEFVVLKKDSVIITDYEGNVINKEKTFLDDKMKSSDKCGYDHFMIKEIKEQPKVLEDTLEDGMLNFSSKLDAKVFSGFEKIYFVACGTAYHAGLAGKFALEKLAKIPVQVILASEFKYANAVLDEKTLVVSISQSGETADTIASVKLAKEKNAKVLGVVNVLNSSIAQLSDFVLYTKAGLEIAVASTKAYTTQLVVLYLFSIYMAEIKNEISKSEADALKTELRSMPKILEEILKLEEKIIKISERIYKKEHMYYLGRGMDYTVAKEGALKMKEVSYIHAEAYAGGELKHGPIALVEEGTLVIAISTDSDLNVKTQSNIKEVLSRGAKAIGILTEETASLNDGFEDVMILPKMNPLFSPIGAIVPLQLLSYHTALKKGCDVDKPRNLAKSVTVE